MPRDILTKALEAGLDLDSEMEAALTRRLELRALDAVRLEAEIEAVSARYNAYIEQHGSFADEWRSF